VERLLDAPKLVRFEERREHAGLLPITIAVQFA
jgi:hypothetical protein